MFATALVLILLAAVMMCACGPQREAFSQQPPAVVFTMTACPDRAGRHEILLDALESLRRHEPDLLRAETGFQGATLASVVVLEAYAPGSTLAAQAPARLRELRERFPGVTFVQKQGVEDAGQARSLNMLLLGTVSDAARAAAQQRRRLLWVHWEESWLCTAPFLVRAAEAFAAEPRLAQLQLTPDWRDLPPERLQQPHPGWLRVLPDSEALAAVLVQDMPYHEAKQQFGLMRCWPLYSLRPSVNDAAAYLRDAALARGFDERAEMWPVAFEYEYAKHWLRAGCDKGAIEPPAAARHVRHVSTYHQTPA